MSVNLVLTTAAIVVALVVGVPPIRAQSTPAPVGEVSVLVPQEAPAAATEAPAAATETPPIFKAEQLEQLLAPIALYPDALLAQILMAATYPLEIVKARRWLQYPGHAALQGSQLATAVEAEPWDPSVKSLVPFARILQMMDDQLEWTEQLGSAFLAQQANVMDAIQRLRHQAAAAGTLWSTAQQRVTTEGQGIVIEPATPEMVYPPVYNPTAVYGPWPYPDYPPLDIVPSDYDVGFALPFGIGFGVGVGVLRPLWRRSAFDWGGRRIQLNVDKFSSIDGSRLGAAPSIWQHDPAHRISTPNRDPAWHAPFASFPVRTGSPAAFSRASVSSSAGVAPTTVLRAAPAFFPAGRGAESRIMPQLSHPSRQITTPPAIARHFAPLMMPRTGMPSTASAPQAGGRFSGGSHR